MLQFQRSWEINGMSIIIPPLPISFKLLSALKGRENFKVFLMKFQKLRISSRQRSCLEILFTWRINQYITQINLFDWDIKRSPRKTWPPSKWEVLEVHKCFPPKITNHWRRTLISAYFLSISFFPTMFPLSIQHIFIKHQLCTGTVPGTRKK